MEEIEPRNDAGRAAGRQRIALYTTATRRMRLIQKVHAVAVLLVPLAGSLVALMDAAIHEVDIRHVIVAIAMYCLTVLSITVGFHRLLAHRAFEARQYIVAILTIVGCMAAQGPPIYWVSNHRRHHRYADRLGDPHSPYWGEDAQLRGIRGFWHAHCGWTFDHQLTNTVVFAADLLKNDLILAVNRHYYGWVAAGLALPMFLGWFIEPSLKGVEQGFLWGGCVRLACSYHATNAINSLAHMWGTRPHLGAGASRNNVLLAVLTFGEGWHNNHHAAPTAAVFGSRWWQLDIGGLLILGLRKIGAVTTVRVEPGRGTRQPRIVPVRRRVTKPS